MAREGQMARPFLELRRSPFPQESCCVRGRMEIRARTRRTAGKIEYNCRPQRILRNPKGHAFERLFVLLIRSATPEARHFESVF